MSKAPAMPMYWDAYLADTTHLTTEEHGAYMLLLAAMWRRNGSVPDDDKDNARILGLTPAKWRKVKARLTATISGFYADGDAITQEKLQKTWENTQEKIAKNGANGALGGRPKSKQNKDLAKANGSVSLKPNQSIPEPEPKEIDKSISTQEAADYQKYLDAHPKPVESKAGEDAFSKLVSNGVDPNQIISAATAYADTVKGWSAEAKVQQSDNFLDAGRGKWKDHIPKPKAVPASEDEIMRFWADSVKQGRFVNSSSITAVRARAMVAAGYVTEDQLTEKGIAV
jgi:uncharacterized protein YdaU (DUF1376 family)